MRVFNKNGVSCEALTMKVSQSIRIPKYAKNYVNDITPPKGVKMVITEDESCILLFYKVNGFGEIPQMRDNIMFQLRLKAGRAWVGYLNNPIGWRERTRKLLLGPRKNSNEVNTFLELAVECANKGIKVTGYKATRVPNNPDVFHLEKAR